MDGAVCVFCGGAEGLGQVVQIDSSLVLWVGFAYVWWWVGEGGHSCGGLLQGLWVPGVGGALVSVGGSG